MKKIIFIVLFCLVVLSVYSKQYEYALKHNNKIKKILWDITEKQSGFLLYYRGEDIRQTIKSKKDIGTISWLMENRVKQSFIKAERITEFNKSIVKITGIIDGNKIVKAFEPGNIPWIQSVEFEMKDFILSDKNEMKFWTIRWYDGEPVLMKIEKKEVQEKVFLKKKIKVIFAEVKEDSILSNFSVSKYWFKKKNGLCIAFYGNDGTKEQNKVMIKLIRE